MPPSLSGLKVLPSFCFAFKIPDDVAASTMYVYSLIFKIIFFALFSILLRQICWERERDISHVFTRADVEQTMLMEISWRRWAELQEQESYKTKMYF